MGKSTEQPPLNCKEMARRLGVTLAAVKQRIQGGRIVVSRVPDDYGNYWLAISASEAERVLREQPRGKHGKPVEAEKSPAKKTSRKSVECT